MCTEKNPELEGVQTECAQSKADDEHNVHPETMFPTSRSLDAGHVIVSPWKHEALE